MDFSERGPAKIRDRLGHVLGVDVDAELRARAVERLQVALVDAVRARALGLPVGRPDARALDHGVRVDGVHADPVRAALLREAAREMERRGLRRRVGGGVGAGDERVLRGDEDDRAAASLLDQDPEGLPRGEEVPAGEHRVVQLPLLERRLGDRRARGEARRGDEDVEPAVLEHRAPRHLGDRVLARHVAVHRERPPKAVRRADLLGDLCRAVGVEVGDDDVGAARREHPGRGTADPARAAGDHRDTAGELAARRRLRELVPLERPVLDRERLALAQRAEAAERVRRVLDGDRPVVQVARDAGARRHRSPS